MLRYRVLLIDLDTNYRRPVQAYFNNMEQVTDWCNKVLPTTRGAKSWVEIYECVEKEIGRVNKKDVPLKLRPEQKEIEEEQQGEEPEPPKAA